MNEMESIQAAVVTVSDTRLLEDDVSGSELVRLFSEAGIDVVARRAATDDTDAIRELLLSLCDRGDIDLIVTTGGTGFAARDNTPEATHSVIEREAPGLAEAMRSQTLAKTPMAMLSRAVCGIRGRTLIINMPGSPKAVTECFEVLRPILAHAVSLIRGNTSHNDKS